MVLKTIIKVPCRDVCTSMAGRFHMMTTTSVVELFSSNNITRVGKRVRMDRHLKTWVERCQKTFTRLGKVVHIR